MSRFQEGESVVFIPSETDYLHPSHGKVISGSEVDGGIPRFMRPGVWLLPVGETRRKIKPESCVFKCVEELKQACHNHLESIIEADEAILEEAKREVQKRQGYINNMKEYLKKADHVFKWGRDFVEQQEETEEVN